MYQVFDFAQVNCLKNWPRVYSDKTLIGRVAIENQVKHAFGPPDSRGELLPVHIKIGRANNDFLFALLFAWSLVCRNSYLLPPTKLRENIRYCMTEMKGFSALRIYERIELATGVIEDDFHDSINLPAFD